MKKEDLIYIAAFWEAEGSLYVKYRKRKMNGRICKYIHFDVGIGQKNPSILYWIKDTIGFGNVNLNRTVGIYYYRCAYKLGRKFLKMIFPYMRFRRKQVIDAWKFRRQIRRAIRKRKLEVCRTPKHRKIMSEMMKRVRNQKYWSGKKIY